MYVYPSIIAHTLNGGLFLVAVILTMAYYRSLSGIDSYRVILLVLLFGIIVGIHGLSHLGLEYAYGYNPWTVLHPLYPLQGRQGRQGRQMTCPYMKSCPCHRQMRSEGMQGHPPYCPGCPYMKYCPYRQRVEGFQMKPEDGPTCAIRGND